MMTNKELVTRVLWTYGSSTSKQVANLIHRDYGVSLTPARCAGAIRPLIASGKASSSNCGAGQTRYWLNKDAANWKEEELNSLKNIVWKG